MGNVMVERLWQWLKNENVYMNAYETEIGRGKERHRFVDRLVNAQRPHSSLDGLTPDEAYCGLPDLMY